MKYKITHVWLIHGFKNLIIQYNIFLFLEDIHHYQSTIIIFKNNEQLFFTQYHQFIPPKTQPPANLFPTQSQPIFHLKQFEFHIFQQQITITRFLTMDNQLLTKITTNYQRLKSNPHFQPLLNSIALLKNIITSTDRYMSYHCRPETMYISFNGGKDSTIVIFLMYLAINQYISDYIYCKNPTKSDASTSNNPTPSNRCSNSRSKSKNVVLDVESNKLKSTNYQNQLTNFVKENPISWIVMGTRKSDPGCEKLGELTQSDVDKGYPDFVRVNPIIEWQYTFVWEVIKQLELPYCILYDNGYTSLGNSKNTHKHTPLNPTTNQYLPASCASGNNERKNRTSN